MSLVPRVRVHVTLHGFPAPPRPAEPVHAATPRNQQELDLAADAKADDAPRALGVRPELVLVFRSDGPADAAEPIWKPLPADAPLRDGDRLRILRVVSGGSGARTIWVGAGAPARSGRLRAHPPQLFALVVFVALFLVAPALADHVYSHRFVVEGRLVGIDGTPLPGRLMTLTSTEEDFLENCQDGQQHVTDESGDFKFCYHQHDLAPSAKVFVTYGNVTATRPVDVALRTITVFMREPNETGIAPQAWEDTYRISGRAWRPGPQRLEGIQVFGEAVAQLPINLTIRGPDATAAVFHTTTDGYGDFDLVVETGADGANLSLTLETMGRGQPVQLDGFFHRANAPIYVNPISEETFPASTVHASGLDEAPGSTTPKLNPVLGVAVAVGLVAAIIMSRRKRAEP